jgi:SAM-dependent methyltransferase
VLDFGCGKLRYTIPIAARVRHVTAVDSTVQLQRQQLVAGIHTSVSEYVTDNLANARAVCVADPTWRNRKYDYVLCANVLSSIPNQGRRVKLLKDLKAVLRNKGRLLVVVQYRNTYFSAFQTNPNAVRHYDGWLVTRGRYASFYGLIAPTRLARLCKSVGLAVPETCLHGECSFTWAQVREDR